MSGKKVRIWLSYMLLALFVSFKASITMFAHVHIVDGTTVVHSHPYSDKHHTHTVPQMVTIAGAAALQSVEPLTSGMAEVVLPLLCEITVCVGVAALAARHTCNIGVRGPPLCCR